MGVRSRALVAAVLSLVVVACGEASDGGSAVLVPLPPREEPPTDPARAGQSVAAFGFDLLSASADDRAPGDNLIVSPLSVAIALGMVEPGASGETGPELHDLLRIDDPALWHQSMNALEQSLETRLPDPVDPSIAPDQDPGELHVNVANRAFLAPGYGFRPDYLDAIGTNYGAALEELDFTDTAAAADRINAFIAGETDDHITELLTAETIEPATVLALVNALLLRASWLTEFDGSRTVTQPFTRIDGSSVDIPLMHGSGDRSGRGDGWVGASKSLVGRLRFEAVLPDVGRFDDVAGRYEQVVAELTASPNPGGELGVPRFETRVNVPLPTVLQRMGLTAPFVVGGLIGIADDPKLVIDDVLHETWLAVDESGIEAAAATVVLLYPVSATVAEPVPVVLDRPFLFRIVDDVSGATLFTGRVMDPTT